MTLQSRKGQDSIQILSNRQSSSAFATGENQGQFKTTAEL
jgi:hypothetical protein